MSALPRREENWSVPSLASEHPAIDHLRSTSGGVLHARVPCDGGVIGVVINPDGQSVETSVSLAETVMENITDLGHRGRELVAAGALEDYNAGRRFSEHSAGAGVMAMFAAPAKSKAEFCASLTLFMVRVTGAKSVTLTFACGDFFSRHDFSVTSSDGVGFNDVHIDLQNTNPDTPRDVPNWWHPMDTQGRPPQPYCLTTTQRALKRSVDIVGALIALVLLGPVYLLVAAAVRMEMGTPLHYWQVRLGQGGRPFRCYKFRSMVKEPDQVLQGHLARDAVARARWDKFQKLDNDPRITRVGRVIRRLSLDDLPQLFNVLKGDMSLVGPRPCMARQRSLYGCCWAHYCHMRPGITGLWQVSGRNHLPYADRVALDARYATEWSVLLDARILARTLWVVLSGDGSS